MLTWYHIEKVFLRGLYELRTGENQYLISELVFGGDQPGQSRAFKYFIDHIDGNFSELVNDNLSWWYNKGWELKLEFIKGTKTLKVYRVASILRNCHIILYGGITSSYFKLEKKDFPTLTQYLRQE
jgi:hypothetical protein